MKKHTLNSSILIVSLLTISFVMTIILLTKEKFIQSETKTQNYQMNYLSEKFSILTKLNKQPFSCNQIKDYPIMTKNTEVKIETGNQKYAVYCVKKSLFIGKTPTKEKYIHFKRLADVLDLTNVEIIEIAHLDELPASTEQDPKIVLAKGVIDETLNQDFYGIIITAYYFDIKGSTKFYGTLYSSYDNNREERNMTFKKKVILNLENKYTYWQELSSSRNMLNNE